MLQFELLIRLSLMLPPAFFVLWPQVHWISSTSFDDGVLLELIELDHLITKKKLEEV